MISKQMKYSVVMDRSKIYTALVDKQFSPMIIRKYTHWGFPIYVGLITDDDLTELDKLILDFMEEHIDLWTNDIQGLRNLAGKMTEHLNLFYKKSEGVAVVIYADKCFISSLHGDFMNHTACRIEFYSLLTMSTGV